MASNEVVQKVKLDATQYRQETRKMSTDTRKDTDKVNDALNESGNAVRDFNDRVQDNTKKSKSAFEDLFKGIKGGLGALGLAGVGAAIGAAVSKGVSDSLNFTDVLNKIAVKTGQNAFQQAEFRNQLLGISDRTNVDEEQIAAAAENAIALGASTQEAVRFAEVIAQASRAFKDVDPASFSREIASDLRARGQRITEESVKKSLNALTVGVRQGLGDIETAFEAVSAVPGRVQERAGLSQRDLVNLFAGTQGVSADPQETRAAIQELIKVTDQLDGEALQGVLGAFRGPKDAEGNRQFLFGTSQLNEAARRLEKIGDDRVQREVLQKLGLSEQGTEGILSIVRDRAGFQRERGFAELDQATVKQAFERSTEGFGEAVSNIFNRILNSFSRDTTFEQREGVRIGQPTGPSAADIERARLAPSPLALPGPASTQNINLKVEIESKDPGLTGKIKSTDLPRQPGGF